MEYDPHWVSPFGHLGLLTAAHASSELFAVYHVLLRHLTPRHPPYALIRFFLAYRNTENLILSRPSLPFVHDGALAFVFELF
jgi:hypothetical protein